MKLIMILAALGLERYLDVGAKLQRHKLTEWFTLYMNFLRSKFAEQTWWKGWVAVVVVLVPPLLVLGLVFWPLCYFAVGFFAMLLGLVVLIYCFGPEDLYIHEEGSKKPKHATTPEVLVQANESYFGVIFWFILLGPVGALLYRGASLLEHNAEQNKDEFVVQVTMLYHVLDWVPARLTTLCYALAGNFAAGFKSWLKHVASGLQGNAVLLTESSLLALGVGDKATSSEQERQEALELVDRALIIVLVLVAVFTLGAWIS